MRIDKNEKLQYDINREAEKIPALSSGKTDMGKPLKNRQ